MAFLFTSLSSNAQDLTVEQSYNTGNIVIDTPYGGPSSWANGVYQDNLTCWSWGDPGYCGPNAIVRPGNNINFSYGLTDLYQVQAISNVLPNSGTGLVINGYNFSFTAKNGNGWDGGKLDTLSAYVSLYDLSGNITFNKNYNLTHIFNWKNFNFSETFKTPFATSDLSSVRYGFIGRDENYWAGPYGPEVTNISFSLKYSVDPCSVNVLSSPSCPGYLEKISGYSTSTSTTLGSVSVSTTPVISTTTEIQPTSIFIDAGGVQVSTTGTISVPDNIPQSVKDSQKQETEEKNKTAPNMGLVMSVLRQVQANDRAIQNSAVQNALEEVSAAISNSQEQTNMVLENNQRANEKQEQETSLSIINSTAASNIGLQIPRMNEQPIQQSTQQFIQIELPKFDYSLTPQETFGNNFIAIGSESSKVEMSTQQLSMSDLNNPIGNILQQKTNIENTNQEQKTETVKSNVQSNELAGNIDINRMAVNPPEFNAYMSLTLKDGQLYKPEDIYKNQVTVDNVRALRQLSSDRLHQQMVEQQYRN